MSETQLESSGGAALLSEFFAQDDLKNLAADAGELLQCPLIVLDDAFRVAAYHRPLGFSDPLFQDAVRLGEITYEAGAVISRSKALSSGKADYVKLDGTAYRRRFAPLISAGVRLGCLICVDTDGRLQNIPAEIWQLVEQILAKQMFIEASRHDKPFETAEDILMHLLDGGFTSAAYFRLQAANTYLADFHPTGFALIDLTAYRDLYSGKRQLKAEIDRMIPHSHSFLHNGDVFAFLTGKDNINALSELAEEFRLKVVVSEELGDLYELPALCQTAREALGLMKDARFKSGSVCTVAQLRTALLLKSVEGRRNLIAREVRTLAAHDHDKGTQYCETLYYYLITSRSIQKTCDALFTHRNTVLYRIRRIREDFLIPLDEPSALSDLLFSVSMILFETKGPDFFYTPRE